MEKGSWIHEFFLERVPPFSLLSHLRALILEWDRYYETAGVHAIITDHEDWSPSKVARTYFRRKNIEDIFRLTKKALVVPVEPPYM